MKYKFNLCVFSLFGEMVRGGLCSCTYTTRIPVAGIKCGRSCMGPSLIRVSDGMDGVCNRTVQSKTRRVRTRTDYGYGERYDNKVTLLLLHL